MAGAPRHVDFHRVSPRAGNHEYHRGFAHPGGPGGALEGVQGALAGTNRGTRPSRRHRDDRRGLRPFLRHPQPGGAFLPDRCSSRRLAVLGCAGSPVYARDDDHRRRQRRMGGGHGAARGSPRARGFACHGPGDRAARHRDCRCGDGPAPFAGSRCGARGGRAPDGSRPGAGGSPVLYRRDPAGAHQRLLKSGADRTMERKPASAKSRTRLSSVANSLRLIKAFSEDEYEIGISDLAKRLGLAKSTVHRLASTLLQAGILEQNSGDGKYHLGLALVQLGAMVRRKMDFTMEARPFLRTLMEKTGETVHLAILDHDSILYIITHESKQALRMGSKVGTRVPELSTAGGKALLAFQSEEDIDRIIGRGHPVSPQRTIVHAKASRRSSCTKLM